MPVCAQNVKCVCSACDKKIWNGGWYYFVSQRILLPCRRRSKPTHNFKCVSVISVSTHHYTLGYTCGYVFTPVRLNALCTFD